MSTWPLLVLLLSGCASVAERPLRVLVCNIHAGKDASAVDNLERVAALIGSTGADVVVLQEIDRETKRSGEADYWIRIRSESSASARARKASA